MESKRAYEIGPERRKFQYTVKDNRSIARYLEINIGELMRGIYVRELPHYNANDFIGKLNIDTTSSANTIELNTAYGCANININSDELESKLGDRNINSVFMRSIMLSLARELLFIHGVAFEYKNQIYLLSSSQKGTGKSTILDHLINTYDEDINVLSGSYLVAKPTADNVTLFSQRHPDKKIHTLSRITGGLENKIITIDEPIIIRNNKSRIRSLSLQYNKGASGEIIPESDTKINLINAAKFPLNLSFLELSGDDNFLEKRDNYLSVNGFYDMIGKFSNCIKDYRVYIGSEENIHKILRK